MRIEPGATRPSTTSTLKGVLTRAAAVAGLGAVLVVGGPAAWAEPPMSLTAPVTDSAGVLGGDKGEVEQRLSELQQKEKLDLHVVYVRSFDGVAPTEWAKQTYQKSGLGGNDVLLAVATQDRRYGTYATGTQDFTQQDLQKVNRDDIEPALRKAASGQGSWGDAAIAAAEGFDSVGGGGGGGAGMLVAGGAAALAIGGGAYAFSRRRRKVAADEPRDQGTQSAPGGPPRGRGPQDDVDPGKRAAAALIALDDEIRSSGEELAFAEAQFGTQATATFRDALEKAKAGSVEAFRIQHQIDDGTIAEADRPAAYDRIVTLATDADRVLEEHTEEFQRMRDLQSRAPQLLGDLDRRVGEVRGRLPAAKQQLAALQATYPEQALRTVKANVNQAAALADAAAGLITSGRAHVQEGDRPAAVVSARGAEDALGQATSLLDAVDRAHVDLGQASEKLEKRLASISSDVADAERLGADDPLTREALAAALQAIEHGRAARTGGDPLGALAALDTAENDLDAALQGYRDAEENARRAQAGLDDRFGRVRARLMSIDDSIRTRRGAVGSEARTRISEALRVYNEATGLAGTEPERAASLLNEAERLGEDALRLADDDHDAWGGGYGGGYGGRGWGGGWGGPGRSGGIDLGSLILGGILMGGGGHHGGGGSWGGGDSWGGGGGGFGGGFGGGGDFGGGFGDGGSF